MTPIRWLKLGKFKGGEDSVRDIHTLMKDAMDETGLNDFGDLDFVSNYMTMFATKSHSSFKFSNLGYIGAKIEMGLTFQRRLKLVQYLKTYPEVASVPVRSPVFVMGLPRTGTTYLHRLLSLDPDTRAPLMWELLNPIPSCGGDATSLDQFQQDRFQRSEVIRKMLEQRKSIGDYALKHIHEVEYDLAEECILCLADEIPVQMSTLLDVYLNMDTFLKFDGYKAYEYYKKILQVLSYQMKDTKVPKKWVLKCPLHTFYVKEIERTYPDAKIIWTHRHPTNAIPSMCSLLEAFSTIYYEPECVNRQEIGRCVCDVSGNGVEKCARELNDCKLQYTNVIYDNLIKRPLETIKEIYKQYGWEVSQAYENNILNYLEENKRERELIKLQKSSGGEKLHSYSPEDYKLTSAELTQGKYADYIKKYNIPPTK